MSYMYMYKQSKLSLYNYIGIIKGTNYIINKLIYKYIQYFIIIIICNTLKGFFRVFIKHILNYQFYKIKMIYK